MKSFICIILLFISTITYGDCVDFSIALPNQTYIVAFDGDNSVKLRFGESRVSGFCPSGEAQMTWIECIQENGKEYCAEQALPLTYQTRESSDWILIPNLAVGWLMSGDLYLIPLNTPMLQMTPYSSAGPVPWGSW